MRSSRICERIFDGNMDFTSPGELWLRSAEIRHGRVCMLAFHRCVSQQLVPAPGLPSEPDWRRVLAASYAATTAALGAVELAVSAMTAEGCWNAADARAGRMAGEVGDMDVDPCRPSQRTGVDLQKLQRQDLMPGRLVVIGLASLAANHVIAGSAPFLGGLYAELSEVRAGASATACCGTSRPAAVVRSLEGLAAVRSPADETRPEGWPLFLAGPDVFRVREASPAMRRTAEGFMKAVRDHPAVAAGRKSARPVPGGQLPAALLGGLRGDERRQFRGPTFARLEDICQAMPASSRLRAAARRLLPLALTEARSLRASDSESASSSCTEVCMQLP
mmetsp:Transcript_19605/g.61689  ORF Transcript_19605/g.61689 Transcript_19605/m.61689 type:complete len:334 (+) Transcript_19605:246-1247(+)